MEAIYHTLIINVSDTKEEIIQKDMPVMKKKSKKDILSGLEDLVDQELADAIQAIDNHIKQFPIKKNLINAWTQEAEVLIRQIKALDENEGKKYETIIQEKKISQTIPTSIIKKPLVTLPRAQIQN
jgi:hypothetical protein